MILTVDQTRQSEVGAHKKESTGPPVLTFWHTPGPKMFVPPSDSTNWQLSRVIESVIRLHAAIWPHPEGMPSRKLMATPITLDRGSNISIARAAAERDDGVCFSRERNHQDKGEIYEGTGEFHN
ncbi:hypothetical protein CVT26_006258 [Gymnopilus dilepis]|uniref:Uncharacterized protein n=1 Tax=Gymnopilus dilepis TaxID=231916 RepID=A0A409Y193_9AGAR|nr:hypothetical protein CVT26_006258 [Gymnopilus dilepis]